MRKVFLIGGLGADERVFRNLTLPQFEKVFINWIIPTENESIESYAKRLSIQITEPEPFILGVSFGGMVAIELAKWFPKAKVVIISSAKTYKELPLLYRIIGYSGLLNIMPVQLLKYHNRIVDWFFGVESKSESNLLKSILTATDNVFLRWALKQIALWKNKEFSSNLTHIHGDTDRILPVKSANPNNVIADGGHLMILNRAKEIDDILQRKFTRTII